MAVEKKWLAIPPTAFTADGTTAGVVTVANAHLFHVKQKVKLYSNTIPDGTAREFIVNRVTKLGTIEVGNIGKNINDRADVSAFTLSDSAQIYADFQDRPTISHDDFDRAVYEEEPAVALRTIGVDAFGEPYSDSNPMPIAFDGTIAIGRVYADITAKDDDPNPGDVHDSVRIGDGTNEVSVNSDGSINVNIVNATPGAQEVISFFSDVSSVVAGVSTDVLTYTVPVGKTFKLYTVEFSGSNTGVFETLINGSTEARKRTYFGGNLFDQFAFNGTGQEGLLLVAGDIIKLTVIHSRPYVGDFEGRVLGMLLG